MYNFFSHYGDKRHEDDDVAKYLVNPYNEIHINRPESWFSVQESGLLHFRTAAMPKRRHCSEPQASPLEGKSGPRVVKIRKTGNAAPLLCCCSCKTGVAWFDHHIPYVRRLFLSRSFSYSIDNWNELEIEIEFEILDLKVLFSFFWLNS